MKDWKAGDLAAFEIRSVSGSHVYGQDTVNYTFAIPKSQLRPLPTAMTEAEKALIEHVIGVDWRGGGGQIERLCKAALIRACPCTPNPLHDAAPDMLAALEEVMKWIEKYPHDFVFDERWLDTEDRVYKAIDKAKGISDD